MKQKLRSLSQRYQTTLQMYLKRRQWGNLNSAKELGSNIALTQRLVKKLADIVHQFALELRPPALDDLGLIPALCSLMEKFTIHAKNL